MSDVEVRFAGPSRLDLAEGDTLVLRIPADVDGGEAVHVAEQVRDRFPGHPVVVLAAGVELEAATLHDVVAMFTASRDALRAALAQADRSGVGRNEIARIAAPAHSRATVLKMLAEDNGPSPTGPVEGQLVEMDGARKRYVDGEWIEAQ